jgi:hypothetical protein
VRWQPLVVQRLVQETERLDPVDRKLESRSQTLAFVGVRACRRSAELRQLQILGLVAARR